MKTTQLIIYLILTISCFGQRKNIISNDYSHFQLTLKKDTIDFVVADANLTSKKPILLFCQGSQPIPLFIDVPDQGIVPVAFNNFDVNEMKKHYHVVVISMPKTPLIVGLDHLNFQYNYITDTSNQYSYSQDYLLADYAENYINRANKVIKFLMKQNWVSSDKIVVAGHSQGARITVGIAASNKNVVQIGLFGYNPNGRIDGSIRQARKKAEAGQISWEKADSLQRDQVDFYKMIHNEDSIKNHPSLKSWVSFSKPTLNQLLKLKIPVYIAYGSQDIGTDLCDLLPLYFIENKKSNYKIVRYPNLEHNFFPLNENGKPDYQNGKWKSVMNEFINWTKNENTAISN